MNGDNSERLPQEGECRNEEEYGILERASAFSQRVLEEIETLAGTTACKSVQLLRLKKWAQEKKELSDAEKEIKSKRRQIQEKLMKFATRIPIFMYLTDFREYSLKDVILQLEPKLFERVTGLTKQDFALLVSLNVFNEVLMNDAVYKFKRYEDSSLAYAGVNRHAKDEKVGGYSTVITMDEYLSS